MDNILAEAKSRPRLSKVMTASSREACIMCLHAAPGLATLIPESPIQVPLEAVQAVWAGLCSTLVASLRAGKGNVMMQYALGCVCAHVATRAVMQAGRCPGSSATGSAASLPLPAADFASFGG